MISQKNAGGGITITLVDGDSLDDVPSSHQGLMTPEILSVFENPVQYFKAIADQTELPSFRRYLHGMESGGQWSLVLADTFMMERSTIAAFLWKHPHLHWAMIAPRIQNRLQSPFGVFENDFQFVHWNAVGFSGGTLPLSKHIRLDQYGITSNDERFSSDSTIVFGNSVHGDVMVYNSEGIAGYLSHEIGEAYVIGSIPEMLDWIFAELLENRQPEFDFSRNRNS